jgi:hypothetical protein
LLPGGSFRDGAYYQTSGGADPRTFPALAFTSANQPAGECAGQGAAYGVIRPGGRSVNYHGSGGINWSIYVAIPRLGGRVINRAGIRIGGGVFLAIGFTNESTRHQSDSRTDSRTLTRETVVTIAPDRTTDERAQQATRERLRPK